MNKNIGHILVAIVIVCFLVPSFLTVTAQNDFIKYELSFRIDFSEDEIIYKKAGEYDIISIEDCGFTNEPGKPMIPSKNIMIALPDDMKAIKANIIDFKIDELPGKYNIYPAQKPQHINEEIEFIQPSQSIYSSSEAYPSEYIQLSDQTDLAGQSVIGISLYPIHYIPSENKLTFIDYIEFTIIGEDGYICGDYLPEKISENGRKMYDNILKEMVYNPEDVILKTSDENPQPICVPAGDFDYVIITQPSWVNSFQPLSDWKTKKGVAANIVTTDWIYNEGGYSGNNVQKIKEFVIDAHNNWGTIYFLLGGDSGTVPYHTRTIDGDPIPNDTYYGDYDYDYTVEVHVGRASVTSTSSISTFINKIFTYEQNPPSSYPKKIGLYGFDLNYETDGEDTKTDINNQYIPSGWALSTVYDSHGGNHKTNVINSVNDGQNIINHIDHCGEYYIGTGDYNHGLGLTPTDVDGFSNGNKQSLFYSIGCWPAAFDYTNCIAEHFVRNSNGGGYAFIGNTRYGWFYSGLDDYLSLRYDRYFFRSLFDQNHYKLGECFSDHKTDAYFSQTQDSTNKYIFTELSLLGDPELPIWTDNPTNFDVTHPSQLPQGYSTFNVHVESSGGSNINNALVCLWKENDVFLTGYTNSNGDVSLHPSPSSGGTMYVTVTKHNYITHEGTATVTGGGNLPPDTPTIHGSSQGSVGEYIDFNFEASDPDNDDIYYYVDWGDQTNTGWIGPFNSGDEVTRNHKWDQAGVYNIKAKAKDTSDAESSWSSPFSVNIDEDFNLESTFLLGLISSIQNDGDYISFRADAVLYVELDRFDIKFYSSRERITISKTYQGTIIRGSPGIIFGSFYSCV